MLIFLGENQSNVPSELPMTTQKHGKNVEWIRIKGNGENALDFHIAFYIGLYCKEASKPSFHIVSNDKGFDPLVKHLQSLGFRCVRGDQIPSGTQAASGGMGMDCDFPELFTDMEAKNRPRTFSGLRNHIAGRLKQKALREKWTVDDVVEHLISTRKIDIIKGKISYPGREGDPDWSPATAEKPVHSGKDGGKA